MSRYLDMTGQVLTYLSIIFTWEQRVRYKNTNHIARHFDDRRNLLKLGGFEILIGNLKR